MHISCALTSGLFMPHPLRRHETVIEVNRWYGFTVQRFIKYRYKFLMKTDAPSLQSTRFLDEVRKRVRYIVTIAFKLD
jgi:hypothetical protein